MSARSPLLPLAGAVAAFSLAIVIAFAQPAATPPAQPPPARAPEPAAVAPAAPRPAAPLREPPPELSPASGPAEPAVTAPDIHMIVGTSVVITRPWPIRRVSVTDPKVADVQALSPTQMLVMARNLGSTDLVVWNAQDRAEQSRIIVNADLDKFGGELRAAFRGAALHVSQSRDVIVVSGTLAGAEQAAHLQAFLQASGYKYLNLTRVAGVQQVQLQVRVAEVNRVALRSLTINAFFAGDDFFGGSTIAPSQGFPIAPISIGPAEGAVANAGTPFVYNSTLSPASSVTLFGGFPGVPLEFFLQALSEDRYMRVLAEPNLVAMSGEEASFLAGGEYPIPVVQGASTAGTSISIEYREYGVRLRFRPTVLADGTIQLHVAPEVSQLSEIGAVVLQGFSVPSLLTRKAETTLQLKSGQTFGMAGLLNQTIDSRSSRVPLLGDVPVLGALFRSVRYQKGETELVVLVTANLVEPSSRQKMPVPGAAYVEPNDWEIYAEGRIEGKAPVLSQRQCDQYRCKGMSRLRGPGAWAAYEVPAPPCGRPLPKSQPINPVLQPRR